MNHPPVNPKAGLTAMLNQVQQAAVSASRLLSQRRVQQETFAMQVIRGTEISESDFKRKLDDPTRWDNGTSTSISNLRQSASEAEPSETARM